jgi:hypothetical protein
MYIRFQFSNDTFSHTTASCDSLGIHYQMNKCLRNYPFRHMNKIVEVSRRDRKTHPYTAAVAKLEYNAYLEDKIGYYDYGIYNWHPMVSFAKKDRNPFRMYALHFYLHWKANYLTVSSVKTLDRGHFMGPIVSSISGRRHGASSMSVLFTFCHVWQLIVYPSSSYTIQAIRIESGSSNITEIERSTNLGWKYLTLRSWKRWTESFVSMITHLFHRLRLTVIRLVAFYITEKKRRNRRRRMRILMPLMRADCDPYCSHARL